jgi:hypothetical protein
LLRIDVAAVVIVSQAGENRSFYAIRQSTVFR